MSVYKRESFHWNNKDIYLINHLDHLPSILTFDFDLLQLNMLFMK